MDEKKILLYFHHRGTLPQKKVEIYFKYIGQIIVHFVDLGESRKIVAYGDPKNLIFFETLSVKVSSMLLQFVFQKDPSSKNPVAL